MTRLTVAQALRRAAARATFAPSLHNSQPWRFILTKGMLELHADRARQLRVLDPDSRQLMISCGCALFNARVALAAAGYSTVLRRLPEPGRPDLLARLSIGDPDQPPDYRLAALDSVIELRHTNRRRFAEDRVPVELVDDLVGAAAAEGASLLPIRDETELVAAVGLVRQAIAVADADPAYRAELRAWTTEVPDRAEAMAAAGQPEADQCLLLLWTAADNPRAWLHAGEALQRALLELTERGYAAAILSQVAEVPGVRALLSRQLGLTGQPHLLLRVGRAPMTPATRRRRLVEVLVEHL
jgi:nitroreductase